MTQFNDNRIIAPPIEEEVYPYHPVWRSISVQVIVVTILTVGVVFVGEILGIQFDGILNTIISTLLALIPVMLWFLFSVIPERFVIEPRTNLVIVFVISALAASAIGIPVVNEIFQINQWLPLETALQRILGFVFTVGIIDSAIKFVVLRYFIFPQHLRVRNDTIAYSTASAVGYSVVVSLFAVTQEPSIYSVSMIYIFANYVIQLTSSLFLAYGFSETYFNNALFIAMPINILLAAFVIGIISPFVTGLMNGPLATGGSADRPIFSMGFLIVMLFAFLSVIFFLYNVAEQREREAFSADES